MRLANATTATSRRRHVLAALGFALLLARPVEARPCAVAANLVPNCGFDLGLTDWTFAATAPGTHVTDDGASAPGCVAVDAAAAGNFGLYARSACIDVDPSTAYGLGASLRIASGAIDKGYCDLSFSRFTDEECMTAQSTWLLRSIHATAWREVYGGHITSSTTQSARIQLTCNSEQDFVVRLDDFLLVPAIFVDGFGTIAGTTANWSVTVN